MKNYNELKAEFVDFQNRLMEMEEFLTNEELNELVREYKQWQDKYDIHEYCKQWGNEIYGCGYYFICGE